MESSVTIMYIRVSLFVLWTLHMAHSDILNSDSLFKLNWVGENIQDLGTKAEYLIMTTPDNEKYRCILPDDESQKGQNKVNYAGPSAADLMQVVFNKGICTIRIETYWNFELCHGRHVRQYHEEKEAGKETKLQEFFLGKSMKSPGGTEFKLQTETEIHGTYDNFKETKLQEFFLGKSMKSPGGTEFKLQTETEIHGTYDNFKIPSIIIDGKEIPYYEVLMDDGTICDLRINTPRLTRVRYICEEMGRNELLSIKETSTCEYEAVILTPNLCSHPLYKLRQPMINAINCHAMNGAPPRPLGYEQLYKDTSHRAQFTSPTARSTTSTGSRESPTEAAAKAALKQRVPRPVLIDRQILNDFLSGDHCLHGGQGWWKYEFCYGKFAQQYHTDAKTGTTMILLGTWNKEEHIKWWIENKRTIGPRSVTHFYGHGDICDLTGRPRMAQVKLKCKEDMQPTAVTIYLTEPRNCEYVLGVDSPIICSLLGTADEYGILHPSTAPSEPIREDTRGKP